MARKKYNRKSRAPKIMVVLIILMVIALVLTVYFGEKIRRERRIVNKSSIAYIINLN